MIPFLLLLNRAARSLPFAGSRRIVLVDIGSGLVLSGVLPSVMVDDTYSAKLSARGGVAPYTYSIAAGGLPDGLFIDAGTGIISGTATTKGAFAFTVRVTDLSGAYLDRQYSILVAQGAYGTLTLSGTYDAATVGTAYSSDLTISGGDGAYSNVRVITGSVPAGLALSIVGKNLRLSGTPTGSAGTVNFTVAVDSGDAQTATSAQSVAVSAGNPAASIMGKLLNWWDLSEVAGSTRADSVGGISLVEENAVATLVDGTYGRVANITAAAKSGLVNYSGGPPPTQGKYTYFGLINPRLSAGNGPVFGLLARTAGGFKDGLYIGLSLISSSVAAIWVGVPDSSGDKFLPDPTNATARVSLPASQWSWWSVEIEPGINKLVVIRVNGVVNATFNADMADVHLTESFRIGRVGDNFSGYISRFGVVSGSLTDAEAAYLYSGGACPNFAKLQADAAP